MSKPARDSGDASAEPWYRNSWVWLIIAIPAATVAGCLFTIYLALTHPDARVSDPVDTATEQARP
jgi:hypothetical protein